MKQRVPDKSKYAKRALINESRRMPCIEKAKSESKSVSVDRASERAHDDKVNKVEQPQVASANGPIKLQGLTGAVEVPQPAI